MAMLHRIGLSKASVALLRELTDNQVPRKLEALAPMIKQASKLPGWIP